MLSDSSLIRFKRKFKGKEIVIEQSRHYPTNDPAEIEFLSMQKGVTPVILTEEQKVALVERLTPLPKIGTELYALALKEFLQFDPDDYRVRACLKDLGKLDENQLEKEQVKWGANKVASFMETHKEEILEALKSQGYTITEVDTEDPKENIPVDEANSEKDEDVTVDVTDKDDMNDMDDLLAGLDDASEDEDSTSSKTKEDETPSKDSEPKQEPEPKSRDKPEPKPKPKDKGKTKATVKQKDKTKTKAASKK